MDRRELEEALRARREAAKGGALASWIEQELQGERISALGRAGTRLDRAMEALTEALADPDCPVEQRRSRWEAASTARWEMMVVREAVGLLEHAAMDETWPLPRRP